MTHGYTIKKYYIVTCNFYETGTKSANTIKITRTAAATDYTLAFLSQKFLGLETVPLMLGHCGPAKTFLRLGPCGPDKTFLSCNLIT